MNIEMLLKEFKELYKHEERAKVFYDHYIDEVEDEETKKVLTSIRDDEKVHMKLVEELISMVS